MTTTTTPAIEALMDAVESLPLPNGATGLMYSAAELVALLNECSPLVVVGVTGERFSDTGVSVRITVYASFDRTELVIA